MLQKKKQAENSITARKKQRIESRKVEDIEEEEVEAKDKLAKDKLAEEGPIEVEL
jgi:hypothetical protein